MAEFQGQPDDLRELIRSRQLLMLRRQAQYPVGAGVAALLLAPIYMPLALIALGMSAAWSVSTYWAVRDLAAAYLWRYAWLLEPIAVEVLEEGLQMTSARGVSMIRWSGGVVVKALPGCFVLEDEGEDLVLLPKRYLSATELALLQNRLAG